MLRQRFRMSSGPPYKTFGVIEVFCGEYDRKGLEFIREKRFQEAVDYCNERLKKCPDSAYYARQKGIALHRMNKHREALDCFASVLEKFQRYSRTYPPTAEDLLDITFRTLWQYTSILLEMKLEDEANELIENFLVSLKLLEQFDDARNIDYGKELVSPRVAEYAAYTYAIRRDSEKSLAYVQRIVDYWQAYFNYFGEPCNVDRHELMHGMKERFDREPVFEDLRSDERLHKIVDSLKLPSGHDSRGKMV